ncbi:MAG: sulfite exporter TauE/SafE family protein [Bacteroidota bacterium]
MEIYWYHYLIAVAGGLFAGIINTLAGNGSAVTLTIFHELLGLPMDIANGTNRLGILTQGVISTNTFMRNGKLDVRKSAPFVIPIFIGAVAGVITAIQIDPKVLKSIIGYLMIVLLFMVLIKPQRWLRETDEKRRPPMFIIVPVFLALGFYGGFIQMGMGLFFLATMVLVARYSLIDANGVKLLAVTLYTVIALGIFAWAGQVHWFFGAVVAVGQGIGGYLGARFATRYPNANVWVYRILIVVIIIAASRLLNIIPLIQSWFS